MPPFITGKLRTIFCFASFAVRPRCRGNLYVLKTEERLLAVTPKRSPTNTITQCLEDLFRNKLMLAGMQPCSRKNTASVWLNIPNQDQSGST